MKILAPLLALSLAACSSAFAQSEDRAAVQCSIDAVESTEIYKGIHEDGKDPTDIVLEIVMSNHSVERKAFLLEVVTFVQEESFDSATQFTRTVYAGCMKSKGYETYL